VRDSGEAYGPRAGANQGSGLSYGWVTPGTHTPLDLSSNGRNRNQAPTSAGVSDIRLATLMQMQYSGSFGNSSPGAWEIAIPDGSYSVTVTAGDPSYVDSTHTVTVEGQSFISNFKPTSAQTSMTVTRAVSVTGGRLTIDSLGGKNTKIEYVDISPDTDTARPTIRSTTPADGATNVRRDAAVTADVRLPNAGFGIDSGTLNATTVSLSRVSDGFTVPATLNTSGGGDALALQPTGLLDPNTAYRFTVTAGLKDLSGAAFVPTTVNFTTGTVGGPGNSSVAFSKVALSTANGQSYTSVTMGPDGLLYAGTLDGLIVRFPVNLDGTLGTPEILNSFQTANGGARTITGLAFDPSSTASNLIVWVSNGAYAFNNAPDWSGKVTKVSGPTLASVTDIVVGLPRSVRDHETNQPVFGPDGAIYFAQGANSSGGAPDDTWGDRPEHLLTAAVLRLDPTKVTSPPLNVQTEDGGAYNPYAANAPLTIYATGVRNAYDLVWHSNGQLYAPTNGSATGGNIPATPTPLPAACSQRIDSATNGPFTGPTTPAITDTGVAEDDWVHHVTKGGYYGHPDPARCEWVFNGGNPTAATDTYEEPEYPVGVNPDRNWKGATSFDVGPHYSPDGALEYKSNVFGSDLKGKVLVVRYSAGDDVEVLTPGANGDITSSQTGIPGLTGLNDPVDITENPANGNLYVAELGGFDITLLRPGANTGGTAAVATDKSRLVFNGVQNAGATSAQTVTIRNNGDGQLTINTLAVTGTDASQFAIVDLPTLPLQIAPGASLNVNVAFSPTTTGPKKAALHMTTNDPNHATFDVNLRGLGTLGQGGTNEPSLQWILDTYDIPVNVGDPDPSTSDLPLAPAHSDEVPLKQFVKAGSGPVTITPLAVFGPTSNPVLHLGWYPSGSASSLTDLFQVPTSSAQSLNPEITGTTSFDPGGATFGLWTQWPAFSDRLVFQEDMLNTFVGALPHQVKVFPMKAADGSVVANQYIVATEESSGDWNDVPVIVSNVMPVPGPPKAAYSNLDNAPGTNRLVFSRIGTSLTNTNSVHDLATARITNTGGNPLSVPSVSFTGPWQLANPGVLPAVVAPGASLDLQVHFVATGGTLVSGAMVVATNDPTQSMLTVPLAGFWQSGSEVDEPSLVQIVNGMFGYQTTILGPGQRLNQAGLVAPVGDEVLAPFWRRADTTKPVSVRQLAAYRTQNTGTIFKYVATGASTATNIFTNLPSSAQSVLPPLGDGTTPAAGTFVPTTPVFGLKVDGEFSDDTRNSTTNDVANGCPGPCGHHVRFFPLKDVNGVAVANTWLLVMDYNGINYDFQDNVYVVSNVTPGP